MSTWRDGSKTGDFAFVDSNGIRRYRGRTCNVYGSIEDVVSGFFAYHGHRRATVYVYRTREGLFDGTVRELPEGYTGLPELIDAELVHVEGAREVTE